MSGTENEAVQVPQAIYVGADARTGSIQMWCGYCRSPILESGHGQATPYLSSLAGYANDHRRNVCLDPNGPFKAGWAPVSAGLAATKGSIAREVIAGVCRREGHDETNVTTYGDGLNQRFVCGRCAAVRTEPRPDTTGKPLHLGLGAVPITVSIDGVSKHPGWFESTADYGIFMEWSIEMRAATDEQHRGQRIPVEFWAGETAYRGEAIVSAWRVDSDLTARTILAGFGKFERVDGGDRAQG